MFVNEVLSAPELVVISSPFTVTIFDFIKFSNSNVNSALFAKLELFAFT